MNILLCSEEILTIFKTANRMSCDQDNLSDNERENY